MNYAITSKVFGSLYIQSLNMTLTFGQRIIVNESLISREIHLLRSRNLISLVPMGGE